MAGVNRAEFLFTTINHRSGSANPFGPNEAIGRGLEFGIVSVP